MNVIKELDSKEPLLSDLKAVLTLLEEENVTRAAQRLGMSQPALSYQLDRMRDRFSDPLFVRVGGRMTPTPFARRLADPAARVMRIVGTEIAGLAAFDPATTEREFRIGLTELGAITALPKLVRRMGELAPNAKLTPVNIEMATIERALETGAMDIAAGHFPLPNEVFVQQLLYERDYVCIVRQDHPTIGASMTLREFSETPIVDTPASHATHAWLKDEMTRRQLRSRVTMSTRHVAAIPFIVAACDCTSIIPRDIYELLGAAAGIRSVELPIAMPFVPIHQYWHPCMNTEPSVKFFRELVFQTLGGQKRR